MSSLPQQYQILSATISTDTPGQKSVEVAKRVVDLNFYESIHLPYVTGSITLLDDSNLFERLRFRGAERLALNLVTHDSFQEIQMQREFVITNIARSFTNNDKAKLYVLEFMDVHLFLDNTKKISRSYTGNIPDIIQKILGDELNIDLDISYMEGFDSAQKSIRVNIPYLSPLQACIWLKNRLTTINGSPFYLFASTYKDNLYLGNYDTMQTLEAFNEKQHYKYAKEFTQLIQEEDEWKRLFAVSAVQELNQQNAYRFMKMGGLASDIDVFNTTEGWKLSTHHSIRGQLEDLASKGIINDRQIVFDENRFDDERNIKQIAKVSAKTFDSHRNYHDVTNRGEILLLAKANALNEALNRNALEISVPGAAMFIGSVSVGDTIYVDFLNTNISDEEANLHKRLSGKYLILKQRNIFEDTMHNCNLTISKLVEEDE